MNVIIMTVFLLGQTWVPYDYVADPVMDRVVTLDDCAREGDKLLLRRGDITGYVCHEQGDPQHLILPPYDWGRIISNEVCNVRCRLEKYDARRGRTRR